MCAALPLTHCEAAKEELPSRESRKVPDQWGGVLCGVRRKTAHWVKIVCYLNTVSIARTPVARAETGRGAKGVLSHVSYRV